MKKTEQKIANLNLATGTLRRFLSEYSGREIERAGCIQAFEFSFEAFVQFFRFLAAEQKDAAILGTRDAFRYAFHAGLIESDVDWLLMVSQRNNTVHAYNVAAAEAVFRELPRALERFESCLKLILEKI